MSTTSQGFATRCCLILLAVALSEFVGASETVQVLPVSGFKIDLPSGDWADVEFPHGQAAIELVQRNRTSQAVRSVQVRFEDPKRTCQNELLNLKRNGLKVSRLAPTSSKSAKVECAFATSQQGRSVLFAVVDGTRRDPKNRRFEAGVIFSYVPAGEIIERDRQEFSSWLASAKKPGRLN